MTRKTLLVLLAVATMGGRCDKDSDTEETNIDTNIDTSDTDTDTDTDTDFDTDSDSSSFSAAPEGFAFCSGGGRVSGGGLSATLCLGPESVGSGIVRSGGYTWFSGPIFILDPQ